MKERRRCVRLPTSVLHSEPCSLSLSLHSCATLLRVRATTTTTAQTAATVFVAVGGCVA